MNAQETYIIPFRGLKPGVHVFDFRIGDPFFESYPESQIQTGSVNVHLDFEKEERMLILAFRLSGRVQVPCDRCNEPVMMKIEGEERLIIKFGEEYQEQSDEVLIIPELAHEIDIAPFIYDYVHLLVPMRRVHGEEGSDGRNCDPAVIAKLEELNRKTAADPRWSALEKLKGKSKE